MEDRELKKVNEISLNNWVVKDNFLLETKYTLSVIEQKIVLMLISQLDSIGANDLEYYEFNISKLLSYLSLGKKNHNFLKKMLNDLYERKVLIESEDKRVYLLSRWISSVYYNGKEGIIRLGLDSQLKPYLLNISKNFTKFPLHRVLSLNNKHSIRLYEIFKKVEKLKKFKIDIIELKDRLKINDKYKVFRDFRRDFLEPVIKEINEETDINVSYEFIKDSRKITAISFIVERKEVVENILESNENTLVNQMLSLGLSYNKISEFLKKFNEDRLQRNIEYIQNELEKNPNIKNVGGLLNVAIKDDYAFLPPELLKKKQVKEAKKLLEKEKRKRIENLELYIQKSKESISELQNKRYQKHLDKLSSSEDEELKKYWNSGELQSTNDYLKDREFEDKLSQMLLRVAYKEKIINLQKKDLYKIIRKECEDKSYHDEIYIALLK
jgi:plasmid replication initiation protein